MKLANIKASTISVFNQRSAYILKATHFSLSQLLFLRQYTLCINNSRLCNKYHPNEIIKLVNVASKASKN